MFNSHCKSCEYRQKKRTAEFCSLYGEPLSELEQAVIPYTNCEGYRPAEFILGKPSINRNLEMTFSEMDF